MNEGIDAEELLDRLEDRLSEDLESTSPEQARELWFNEISDRADSTLKTYRYRVDPFFEFLEQEGISDLNELATRDIKEFQARRRKAVDEKTSLNNQFGTISQFLAYCHDLNAVTEDVVQALHVPDLTKDERVNTEKLISHRAEAILENLDRYRYATVEHVMFVLLWRTAARAGAIRSLDLEDLYLDEEDYDRLRTKLHEDVGVHPDAVEEILDEVDLPIIWFRNREDTGTRLKKGDDGERVVNITEETAEIVRDYVEVNRPDVTDDYGRSALLASRSGTGRRSRSNIRNWCYILTQPCEFGGDCPHDRNPEDCSARQHGYGSGCPSSRSPHKLRTGSITDHRDRGWSKAEIAAKTNAGERLIDGVYDQPVALLRAGRRRKSTNTDG